jgi:hypothetical protein
MLCRLVLMQTAYRICLEPTYKIYSNFRHVFWCERKTLIQICLCSSHIKMFQSLRKQFSPKTTQASNIIASTEASNLSTFLFIINHFNYTTTLRSVYTFNRGTNMHSHLKICICADLILGHEWNLNSHALFLCNNFTNNWDKHHWYWWNMSLLSTFSLSQIICLCNLYQNCSKNVMALVICALTHLCFLNTTHYPTCPSANLCYWRFTHQHYGIRSSGLYLYKLD